MSPQEEVRKFTVNSAEEEEEEEEEEKSEVARFLMDRWSSFLVKMADIFAEDRED